MRWNDTGMNVVIVPDFTPARELVFEARTLFFLASWIEQFREHQTAPFPLHVCCIGEPPDSVRRMAERAKAAVSIHEPVLMEYGGFANKLRGLEMPATDRLLLLDADFLVLGELDLLFRIDADIAAAPAGKPQVPTAQWRLIYDGLGLAMPDERMASVYGEHGASLEGVALRYAGQEAEAGAMLPYFNSGSLLVRTDCGLREAWEDHLRRIPAIFNGTQVLAAHAVTNNDQVALATALHALKGRGMSFERLPDEFNARLIHFRTGALRFGGARLLHATGFAGSVRRRDELIPAIKNFEERWSEAIRQGQSGDSDACDCDVGAARAFLWNLWEHVVRDAWEV